jgi:Protein of unknown function (DUF3987)
MGKNFSDVKTGKPGPVPAPYPGSSHFPADDELPAWFVDECLDYCRPITLSPDAFHLTAELICMSGLIGPRAYIRLGSRELRPSLSGLVLGLSTIGGKSSAALTAIDSTLRPFAERLEEQHRERMSAYRGELESWNQADEDDRGERPRPPTHVYLQAPHDVTGASLTDCLAAQDQLPEEQRFGMVQYFDEVSSLLDSKGSKFNSDIIQRLTSLHDCTPFGVKRKGDGKGNAQDVYVRTPFMNVLGCSTTEWFSSSLFDDAVSGGFLARFLIFQFDLQPHEARKPPAIPPLPDRSRLEKWQRRATDVFEGDIGGEWVLSASAEKIFEGLHNRIWDDVISKEGEHWNARSAIAGRLLTAARKIALIMEAFDKAGRPDRDEQNRAVISGAMMRVAVRIVDFYLVEMLRIAGTTLAGRDEAMEAKYLAYLESGPKKRSEVYKKLKDSRRGFRVRDFEALMDSLVEQDKIATETTGEKGPQMHRLWTPEDDASDEPGDRNVDPALAEAAEIFRRKPDLHLVMGGETGATGSTGPAQELGS